MRTFTLKSSADDLDLAVMVSEPSGQEPKAIVQICHGMCEHKERYIPFMEYLSENGYICVIHDHRGHGQSVKSPEDLGYMYEGGWQALVADVKVVTDWIRSTYGSALKLFLFGHSMGSMVVRSYAKRWDSLLDALYVCGCPSWNPASSVGRLLAKLLSIGNAHRRPAILQALSFGSFNKPFESEGPNAWVCSDKDALQAYNNDPLCQYQFTANGFDNLLGLCQDCYTSPRKEWALAKPQMPVRFISGAQDPCRINDKKLSEAVALMMAVGYENVNLTTYEGMRHEILNETDKAVVWEDILKEFDSWCCKKN